MEYNNARLAELGISPYQMKQILETRNIIIPRGDILTSKERIVLEPTGNFESVEDLRRTVIKLPDRKDVLFLEDLAHIYRGYIDPPDMKMYSSGLPCLGIALNLREGGDILRMGKEVKVIIKRLQDVYPIGIEFDFVAFQPYHVEKKVVTITLFSSWILSLTMIPFLCVFFLKVKAEKKGFDSKYYRGYRRSLEGLLKHPIITLLDVSIIFIITMQGFRVIQKIFFPPSDKAIYTAEIELPIGTPIEYNSFPIPQSKLPLNTPSCLSMPPLKK